MEAIPVIGNAARLLIAVLALALLLTAGAALAQEEGHKLVPKGVPDIEKGKAALVRGEAGPDGDRFYVEHLSMLQPVSVVLIARDVERPLKLNLSKYRYEESDRAGETGEEGAVAFHFRTQGELKVHVAPVGQPDGAVSPYNLIVWVGDEFAPELKPPVVLASATEGGPFPWKWVAIGLLVLAGLGGVFWLGRRSA